MNGDPMAWTEVNVAFATPVMLEINEDAYLAETATRWPVHAERLAASWLFSSTVSYGWKTASQLKLRQMGRLGKLKSVEKELFKLPLKAFRHHDGLNLGAFVRYVVEASGKYGPPTKFQCLIIPY